MNFEQIIKENKQFNSWKDNLEKQIKNKELEIKKLNMTINANDFRQLAYDKAREVFNILKYNLEYNTERKQFENILKELKIKKYPILNKGHYYPIINEMNFLTDKQKHDLDEFLERFENSYVMIGCSAWYNLKFDKGLEDKIFNFLYDNGIVQKTYAIYCTCGSPECSPRIITEEEYNKFIDYHSITQEDIDKMTDEEYEDYDKRWGEEGYFESGCWNDGDVEVCSIDDLKEHCRLYRYKNVTEANRKLDEI